MSAEQILETETYQTEIEGETAVGIKAEGETKTEWIESTVGLNRHDYR